MGIIATVGGAVVLGTTQVQAASSGPPTYEVSLTNGPNITLGSPAKPSTILRSKTIPVGTYVVQAEVGVVMGPAKSAGGQEGVVCAISTTKPNDRVVSLFGGAGNGSSTSGTGAAGTYGSNVMIGTVKINSANDDLRVVCNSTTGTQKTYVGQAQLLATKTTNLIPS
jgi:hypothetical protein